MSSRVRAISLDLDGTLYRVQRWRVAWRLRSDRRMLRALLAAREQIRQEPAPADPAALVWRQAELVAPVLGLSIPEAAGHILPLSRRLADALTRGSRPYEGLLAALSGALASGLKLAILSDYDPKEKLAHLGLDQLPFSSVLSAEALGALKPSPQPFLHLCQRLEVPPAEVIHVGDREDLDVDGALGAGLRAWRFAPKGAPASRAERVFGLWRSDLFLGL